MANLLAGVPGYANVSSQSRGGSSLPSKSPFASGAGEATVRYEAHILWAGGRLWSSRPELSFSPAWLSKHPRLAGIQHVFAHSVMPYAEKGESSVAR